MSDHRPPVSFCNLYCIIHGSFVLLFFCILFSFCTALNRIWCRGVTHFRRVSFSGLPSSSGALEQPLVLFLDPSVEFGQHCISLLPIVAMNFNDINLCFLGVFVHYLFLAISCFIYVLNRTEFLVCSGLKIYFSLYFGPSVFIYQLRECLRITDL